MLFIAVIASTVVVGTLWALRTISVGRAQGSCGKTRCFETEASTMDSFAELRSLQ